MTGLIDVHGHVVLEGSLGAAGPVCGPELGAHEDGTTWFRVGDWRLDGMPYRESLFMQVGMRLEAMDAAGIRVQALSPNPLPICTSSPQLMRSTTAEHTTTTWRRLLPDIPIDSLGLRHFRCRTSMLPSPN